MRRRRLFTILSVLSLLLCVAMMALWAADQGLMIRSTSSSADLVSSDEYSVQAAHYWFWVQCRTEWDNSEYALRARIDDTAGWSCEILRDGCFSDHPLIGWSRHGSQQMIQDTTAVSLPGWLVLPMLLPLPAWWLVYRPLVNYRRRRRLPQCLPEALCVICGYDLHGAPPEGRCPECGTAVARSSQGHLLGNASPNWLRLLRWGVLVGLIAMFVYWARDFCYEHHLPADRHVRSYLVNALHWLGTLTGTAGDPRWMVGVRRREAGEDASLYFLSAPRWMALCVGGSPIRPPFPRRPACVGWGGTMRAAGNRFYFLSALYSNRPLSCFYEKSFDRG